MLKIHWLIIRGIFHLWISWILTIDFHTVRISSSSHVLPCFFLFQNLSALPEVYWSHPRGCNDICDGHLRCWPSIASRGSARGCPVPFEVTCAGGLQLHSHSGSQPSLVGATVPNHQRTEPGERERWQILGQRGHFWPGLTCVAKEATQCCIRRESDTSS